VKTASGDEAASVSDVDDNRDGLKQRLFNIFSNYNNYMNVSNEAWIPVRSNPSRYDSFESVHDQIHVYVGGDNGGHMSDLRVSAFDPAFWAHHA
jgi:tyrosinase